MESQKNIENNAKNDVNYSDQFYNGKPIRKCRLCIWFGTLWIATDRPLEILESIYKALDAKYIHGQYEQGENSQDNKYGGKHLHFTVHLKTSQYFSWLKTRVKYNVRWGVSKSKAAEGYASKNETRIDGPWEIGTKPKEIAPNTKKAKEKKKISINEAVNMTREELFNKYSPIQFDKVLKFIEGAQCQYSTDKMFKHRVVYYIWGRPGLGKSPLVKYIVKTFFPNGTKFQKLSFKPNENKESGFWSIKPEIIIPEPKYKIAFFEEFRERNCGLSRFMELIDYDETTLNVKGRDTANIWEFIFITSVDDPEKLYDNSSEMKFNEFNKNQLLKRLDCIIHLKEDWKYKYKKYIEAGGLNPHEKLKEIKEINFFDDKIVDPLEREKHEFDIDNIDLEEFCKSRAPLGVPIEAEIKENKNEEEIPTKKYYVYSHKKEERNIFIESLLDSEYNEITFDGKNYKGDDWENSNVLLILNEKVPEKDFLSFIKEEKLRFKTRTGEKIIRPLRFVIAGYDFLNHIYPENEENRESWELHIKNIQIDVETRSEWQDLFSKLNLKLRKVCFDRIHIMVMFKKAEENIRRENEIAEENRKRAERDLEKQREKDLEGSFLSWNSDLF